MPHSKLVLSQEAPPVCDILVKFDGKPMYVCMESNPDRRGVSYYESKDLVPRGKKIKNVPDLLSDRPKYVLHMSSNFYHSVLEEFGQIVHLHKVHGSSIDIVLFVHSNYEFFSYFEKYLKTVGISYYVFDYVDDAVLINNHHQIEAFVPTLPTFRSINDVAKTLAKNEWTTPYRKVYHTRKDSIDRPFPVADRSHKDLFDFNDDRRVDSEEKLSDFFSSHGFEIVTSRDFNSLEDQAEYMSTVKTFISITGSGLTNILFMQPGQTVVDLMSEIITPGVRGDLGKGFPNQSLHMQYAYIAPALRHTYVSMFHKRSAAEVISNFENRPYLMSLLDD